MDVKRVISQPAPVVGHEPSTSHGLNAESSTEEKKPSPSPAPW